jgi:hypothetical protein
MAEVYFAHAVFTDLKWGTMNRLLCAMRFGLTARAAFGTYVMRVNDPPVLIRQPRGPTATLPSMRSSINPQSDCLAVRGDCSQSKILTDMAAAISELGDFQPNASRLNFSVRPELTKLLVENISLPPAVEEALDKRTSMGVVGNLSAFTQFNIANSIPDAAQNPGGLAAAGAGLGLGMAMAGPIGQAMAAQPPAASSPAAPPPPIPGAVVYFVATEGKQTGPYDLQTLASQAAAGRLTRESLVWAQGMAQWTPAGQVPALAGVFANVPPPLPPAK